MKEHQFRRQHSTIRKLGQGLSLCGFAAWPIYACTIFVLTDANRALFCNNEDWSNPKTRIWFVPAGPKHFGCVYVGFDDGWAQGGLNTEGLAFDAVAGYREEWKPDPALPPVLANQELLERCATVDEAIEFYRKHRETGFDRAKILVADRTGASALIGAHAGKLQVEKSNGSRGFGYGENTLKRMLLAQSPEPTVENGARILQACVQEGQYATKYSNVFDLKSGDIFLFPAADRREPVRFNLATELTKGGHYYNTPEIRGQLDQSPQPLLPNMERFLLDKYQPIADTEPKVTAHVRAMLQDLIAGKLNPDDFTEAAWKESSGNLKESQASVVSFGRLLSLTLVDRTEDRGARTYRYRMEFEKCTLLQKLSFDRQNKLVSGRTEDIQQP